MRNIFKLNYPSTIYSYPSATPSCASSGKAVYNPTTISANVNKQFRKNLFHTQKDLEIKASNQHFLKKFLRSKGTTTTYGRHHHSFENFLKKC